MVISCTSRKHSEGKGSILESEWSLISLTNEISDSLLTTNQNSAVVMKVLPDGTVKGTTNCNSFEGQVAIKEYNLKFGNIIQTRPDCQDARLVTRFYTLLDSADNYTVDHGHLLLRHGDKTLARFMSLNMR